MFCADRVGLQKILRPGRGVSPGARRAMEAGAAARAAGADRADVPRVRHRARERRAPSLMQRSATARTMGAFELRRSTSTVRHGAGRRRLHAIAQALGRVSPSRSPSGSSTGPIAAPDRAFLAQRDADRRLAARDATREALARVRRSPQALLDRVCRATGLSSSCRATASSTRCSRSRRCTAACSMRRSRPPIRCRRENSARSSRCSIASDQDWCLRPRAPLRAGAVQRASPGRRAGRLVVGAGRDCRATSFADLEAPPTAAVDDAHARVGPDTIAKMLFTSGSTGQPKGVINTQRMLCSNQEMIRSVLTFLADEPPVLVRLAAVESHGRRQPQLRHRALQRRHPLHR